MANGPSPHVRGKPRVVAEDPPLESVHPRPCGETHLTALPSRRPWVHPRTCGGNVVAGGRDTTGQGPSPHVRGKLSVRTSVPTSSGSIPARAGETRNTTKSEASSRIHPRTCGETGYGVSTGVAFFGPSPHVRGKHTRLRRQGAVAGSIPARAGETRSCRPRFVGEPVHPRTCGGNGCVERSIARALGPSPHVRGNRESHPHDYEPSGPSPHVRGKRGGGPERLSGRGSIPARAGETPPRALLPRPLRVHPRTCGGNDCAALVGIANWGPSPHVRGKLREAGVPRVAVGPSPHVRGKHRYRN